MAEKTINQLIIDALMTGKGLKTADIAGMIDREVSNKDISSLLSKLSNEKKCDLGYFIVRKQVKGIFVYNVVKEAMKLSLNQAYALSLKTGYSLELALEDYPELEKYANKKKAEKQAKPVTKKAKKPVADKPAKVAVPDISVDDEYIDRIEKLAASVLKKISDGDLNINLNLSVKLEK